MCTIDFSNIDAYLFDLGGVIVDISPQAAIDAFAALGLSDLESQITHGHHQGLFKRYELGEISTEGFIDAVQRLLPQAADPQQIVAAWQAMLVNLPSERVALLERLAKKRPVYLLSNTNELHRKAYVSMAKGYDNVEKVFTKAYYSYEIKRSKPDVAAFNYVLDDVVIPPHRILFLDDAPLNLEAAASLGFQTCKVDAQQTIIDIFNEI
ncbi:MULTISPECIES: HAD family hydrolase [unclassified Carboxylicivirga]|uniref:HAD family hydrolase n=1 Tax=Carboxylicivirga TaxID=1628153 RepID=UPI003D3510BF